MNNHESQNKYIKISILDKDSENIQGNQVYLKPSLVTFPLNHPNLYSINDEDNARWILGENKDKKKREEKILIGETARLFYEGKSKVQTISNSNLSDYYIGVFSKKKRELSLIDIDSIFCINQKIKKIEDLKLNHIKNPDENMDINKIQAKAAVNQSYLDKKIQLIDDFGTMKAKKQASSLKSNIINEENISSVNAAKKILESNAKLQENASAMNSEEQLKNRIENLQEILPTFDANESDITNAFDLNSIIPGELAQKINHKETLKLLKRRDNFEKNTHLYVEVTADYLRNLIEPLENKINVSNKIRCGLFLDHMIKFLLLPKILRHSPEDISKNSCIEIEIIRHLLENFTQNSFELDERIKYIKTPLLQHKLIFHIIVLSFILNNFKIDMSMLGRSMKIDNKQMYQFCREIGCNFPGIKNEIVDDKKIKNIKNLIAELKAPLKLNIERDLKRVVNKGH